MIRIGIDISSGEKSPRDLFPALQDYSQQNPGEELLVFLEESELDKNSDFFRGTTNLKIIPVSEVISMEDHPLRAIRKKKNSSIVRGLELLKKDKISFFFSPGNTGAVVYGAANIIGMIRDIQFPAIAVLIPNVHGDVLLLDAGASFLIDEDRGVELAMMGKIFYEKFFSQPNPALGILNIGKEWYKGPKWVRKLDRILKKNETLNYCGYVEGFDLFTSECRVFITGAYTGNILLKGLEGVYDYVRTLLLSQFGEKGESSLKYLRTQLHYSRLGAGVVLGVCRNVFIGHGITGPEALKNALFFAKRIYKLNLNSQIKKEIRSRNSLSRWLKRRKI